MLLLFSSARLVLFSYLWQLEGLAGNSKTIYEAYNSKSKKFAPIYCFEGTPLCYSAFAFGIDQPGLINIGFYGSSMKSNTFEQHSFQANQSVVCGLQIFLKYIPRRAPVAFRTWWGHQYRVGIICSPQLIQVAAIIWWRLIPMSPCPQARLIIYWFIARVGILPVGLIPKTTQNYKPLWVPNPKIPMLFREKPNPTHTRGFFWVIPLGTHGYPT